MTAAVASRQSVSSMIVPGPTSATSTVPSLLSLAVTCAASDLSNLTLSQLDSVPADILCDILAAIAKRSALTRTILAMWVHDIKENIDIDGHITEHIHCLLSSLIQVSLSNCSDLNDVLFEALATRFHPQLVSLDVSRCFALPSLDALADHPCLKTLQTLSLDRVRKFATDSIGTIMKMENLTYLNLSGTNLRDPAMLRLANSFPNLTYCNVTGCLLGIGLSEFCTRMTPVRPLRDLRISQTLFKNPETEHLHVFRETLTCLHVQFKRNTTDEGLVGSLKHLHKLTELDLSRNANVGDPTLCSLIDLHELRTLTISRLDISDISLPIISSRINLTDLDIGFNSQLTSTACLQLRALRNLQVLYVNYLNIDDDWMTTCIPHFAHLKKLKINGCRHLHDISILTLRQAACADTLEQLDLGCPSITNACLPHLISPRRDDEERLPVPSPPMTHEEQKHEIITQSLTDPSFSQEPLLGTRLSPWNGAPIKSTPLVTQWSHPISDSGEVEIDPFPKLFRIGIWDSVCTVHAISQVCHGTWMEDPRMATTPGNHILVRRGANPTHHEES